MDVSRIEAYSPTSRINWKILTAKEILKYNNSGVEVPDVYLQWAKEFINSVHESDSDTTTYEKDVEQKTVPETPETKTDTGVETTLTVDETSANSESEGTEEAEETTDSVKTDKDKKTDETSKLTAAQELRQEMNDDGVSLKTQARAFSKISHSKARESNLAALIMKIYNAESNDEIQKLEQNMRLTFAVAESVQDKFKSEIDKINKGGNSSYAKITEMQKQLETMGKSAQNRASATTGELNSLEGQINDKGSIFSEALDFGSETISIGDELLSQNKRRLIERILGFITVATGSKAVNAGTKGTASQNNALATNNVNIEKVEELQTKIKDKTGVAAPKKDNENAKDTETGEKPKEADKTIKSSNNDGKDTGDKKVTNLDEILKRKIRKGLNPEDPETT